MEAGIVMGAARKALQIYARSADSPSAALAWGNDDLTKELDRETFLTVSYAVLDTASGAMRYVRAGHTPPLLLGPGAGKWQVVKSRGVMIGVTRGEGFTKTLEEVGLELHPGRSLIQYTDGVVEARERGGDEYGTDRLIEHLDKEAGAGKPLTEVVEGLAAEVMAWTGGAPQEDDITILAVRRTG
jgi:sigma-B regulation protein RsbU (phosphoserine phosphatase)